VSWCARSFSLASPALDTETKNAKLSQVIDLTSSKSAETFPDRAVAATLRCLGRWGWRRTSFDDVAREAGCSRATLYRAFPTGKDALLAAVVAAESSRLYDALEAEVAGSRDLHDALVGALATAGRFVAAHDAFRYLLQNEPDVVLPHVCFRGAEQVLAHTAALGPRLLARWCSPVDAARLAEWVGRMALAYGLSPSPHVDVTDRESVARLITTFAPLPLYA
jgi:AcrR family transcriptional regulator